MQARISICSSTLVASLLLAPPTARAASSPQNLCVPETQQAPQWWNPGLSPAHKEASWTGALVRTQSHDGHQARLRAMWSPAHDKVFFEFRLDDDPSIDPAFDELLFAIADPTGTQPELFIRFVPMQACAPVESCTGAGLELAPSSVVYSAASSSGTSLTWTPVSSVNPSLDFEVEHPWIVVTPSKSGYDWTLSFALRVPTGDDGEIVPGLRIYANAVLYEAGPTSGTRVEFPLGCTPTSLISNECLVYTFWNDEAPEALPIGNLTQSWPFLESGGCSMPILLQSRQ